MNLIFVSVAEHLAWMPHNLLLVMKLATFLLIIALAQVSARGYGQKISLDETSVPLTMVLFSITQQSGYTFLYIDQNIEDKKITVHVKNADIDETLKACFQHLSIDYKIVGKNILLRIKEQPKANPSAASVKTTVTGKVTDEHGDPLMDVTIRMQGSSGAWTTNKNGEFALTVPDVKAILQFTFVGLEPKEEAVANYNGPITVVMKESVGSLDDVQVLAYGTTTKRYNTGDVIMVGAAEIGKNPVPNVLQALQNQVPGLFIQQKTGNIGSSFITQIRSAASVGVIDYPLFIVDGVQYPADGILEFKGQVGGGRSNNPTNLGGNALNYLNPSDIESVSILKDADATSLYGSRGAYGVIIITTKKGKAGAAHLDVNAFDGISAAAAMPQLLNTQQYLDLRREAFKNDGAVPGPADLDLNGTWPTDRYTDWRKYYLGGTGEYQNIYMTYSGGNNNNNFLMSGNLRNQRAIQLGKGGEIDGGVRMDVNNTSQDKKFYIDLSVTYNLSRNNTVPFDFVSSLEQAPNAPVPILPDGSLDWSTGSNPAAAVNALYLNTNNNLLANLNVKYNFSRDLAFNAQIGYSLLTDKEYRALPTTYFAPSPTAYTQTTSTINIFNYSALNIDPNISYVHKFFIKLSLDSRIGFTALDRNNYQFQTTGTSFGLDELLNSPTSASGDITTSYTNTPDRYIGGFVYTRLNWDNKYMLSLNGRRDGSTSFGPDHRFGNFGSAAGAWIISEEPWMKPLAGVINFAKVHASYGTVGGSQVGSYQYLDLLAVRTDPYSGTLALSQGRISNPDLHWESKRSEELGFTLQFLNGRIEIDGNYYRTWVNDPLVPLPISTVTGFESVSSNSPDAKLLNWGYEATFNTINIKTSNFKWTTAINLTIPKSKLVSYPGLVAQNSINPVYTYLRLGQPITGISLFNYAGVNPQTGNYSFINAQGVKGDFTASDLNFVTDLTQFIDLAPKYYGGLGNTFSYKSLSAGFFFTFTNRMARTAESYSTTTNGVFNVNPTVDALRSWQKPGDITDEPRVSQNALAASSKIVFDSSTGAYANATYVRLNNVNINYDFTGKWLAQAGIRRLGVYLQGQNLFTISKYKDIDPENVNYNALGPLRVFVAGFKISI